MTASVGDSPPRMPAFGSVAPLLPKVAQTRAGIIVSLLAATGLAVTAANDPRAQRLIGLSFAGGDNVKDEIGRPAGKEKGGMKVSISVDARTIQKKEKKIRTRD